MTIYVTNKLQVTPAAASGEQPITNTYTWLRSGSPISGATGDTYLATDADIGYNLSVIQKAMNVAGFAKATSTPVGPVVEYSPLALFNASEVGVWYDPSDLSTLYQDSAGTTPVTNVEQPVGLMLDKSKGLTLGPELVTNGDFSDGTTGWSTQNSTISVVDGKLRMTVSANGGAYVFQAFSTTPGVAYAFTGTLVFDGVNGNTFLGLAASKGNTNINAGSTPGQYRSVFFATGSTSYVSVAVGSSALAGEYLEIDNISVRELPGNHAYQTTSTSRPVLSARYNLLTKTEQFDDAAWTKTNATVTANAVVAPDGTLTADKFVKATTASTGTISQTGALSVTGAYTTTVFAKRGEWGFLYVSLSNSSSTGVSFNLDTGAVTVIGSGPIGVATSIGNGWYRCSITQTLSAQNAIAFLQARTAASDFLTAGDGTSGIYIWGASLVPSDQASLPYQRVNTSTDYDTVGFPKYLKFDGSDDWMVTPTITPGIDKAQVFAGVRKLSDAALGMVAEHGIGGVNTNQWQLAAPRSAAATYGFVSLGTYVSNATSSADFPAPITNVLTGLGDISGDLATIRINGTQAGSNTSDQGTGDYLAYPLYIGRRGGTTLPFNGHIHSLIVRFGANLDTTTIAQTESWVNGKTLAY